MGRPKKEYDLLAVCRMFETAPGQMFTMGELKRMLNYSRKPKEFEFINMLMRCSGYFSYHRGDKIIKGKIIIYYHPDVRQALEDGMRPKVEEPSMLD